MSQVMRGPTPEEQVLYDNEPLLRWFDFSHLRPELQATSAAFGQLAYQMVRDLERTPERTVCLRKLLEAKDAATRCAVAALE